MILSPNALYASSDEASDESGEALAKLLPATIKHFEIRPADSIPVADVLGLAQAAASGKFPKLEEVRLLPWEDRRGARLDWSDEHIAAIESKLQEANARFTYVWYPYLAL